MKEDKFAPHYESIMIDANSNLKTALGVIASSGLMIACVINEYKELIGVITDSDIRRTLLAGGSLDDELQRRMTKTPVTAPCTYSAEELTQLSHDSGKREIPLIDENGKLSDVFVLGIHDIRSHVEYSNIKAKQKPHKLYPNYVFILAGGLGSRLRSVVSDRPKPMALVGGTPLIEILISQTVRQGFNNFYVATNYLAEQIENYLRQPLFSAQNIEFVRETKRLGTAGSIGFIADKIQHPILVCNADILSNVQYSKILHYHESKHADITCVVRPFQFTVPYGVVGIENNQISFITEKPRYDLLVNAGIYVLSANICKMIEKNKYLDMPDLIKSCMESKKKVIPYLLHEYWIDVGRPEDYARANDEFHLHFGNLNLNE